MAGIGLDAAVVAAAGEQLKRRFGWAAYAAAGMRKLATTPHEFTVCLDDADPLRRQARSVVVANAGLLPGGFTLLPQARLDDGLLDVGILAPSGAWDWIRLAGRVLARDRRRTPRCSGCRPAASGSARMPSCRDRSTARSSRPAGRSASACAREPLLVSAAGIVDGCLCANMVPVNARLTAPAAGHLRPAPPALAPRHPAGWPRPRRTTPRPGSNRADFPPRATLTGLRARRPDSTRSSRPRVRTVRREAGPDGSFADPAQEEERYFAETSIFPVMHVVVLRREVYERGRRWPSPCTRRSSRPGGSGGAAGGDGGGRLAAPLGLRRRGADQGRDGGGLLDLRPGRERGTLRTFVRYSFEQGLIRQAA